MSKESMQGDAQGLLQTQPSEVLVEPSSTQTAIASGDASVPDAPATEPANPSEEAKLPKPKKRRIETEPRRELGKLPLLPPPRTKKQKKQKCIIKAHKDKKKGKCRICGVCVYCPPRSEVCKTLHKRLGQIGRRPADDEMSIHGGKKKRNKTSLLPSEVGMLIRESQNYLPNVLDASGVAPAVSIPPTSQSTLAPDQTTSAIQNLTANVAAPPIHHPSIVNPDPSNPDDQRNEPGMSTEQQNGEGSMMNMETEQPGGAGEPGTMKYSILSTAAGPRLQSSVYREAMLMVTQAIGLPPGGMLVSNGGTSDSAIYRCKARVFEIFQAIMRIFFMGKPPPDQILGELSLMMWKRYDGREYQESKRTEKANNALVELVKYGHPSIKKFCLSVLCTAHTREELNMLLPEEHYVGKVAFHARRSEYKMYLKGEQLKVKGERKRKATPGEPSTVLEMDV